MTNQAKKGQGWHGDSDGHKKAGRKGGLARAKNLKARKQQSVREIDQMDGMPDIF